MEQNSSDKFPGRIHQDTDFTVEGFGGKKLQTIQALVNENGNPFLFYFKTEGAKTWQQFFLDAGLGFWEDHGTTEPGFGEGDHWIDYSIVFGLCGKTIDAIYCKESKITFEFNDGCRFMLKYIGLPGMEDHVHVGFFSPRD